MIPVQLPPAADEYSSEGIMNVEMLSFKVIIVTRDIADVDM